LKEQKQIDMKKMIILAAAAAVLCACGPSRGVTNVYKAGDLPLEENTDVNVGYGTVDRSELTYSVNQLDIDEKEIVSYNDIWEYMRGRVPGVTIGPSEPGKTPSITVRGINSINLSTQPLIMVDGVETDDPSFLNPNDIGSVSVLKDASAAIYGTRGGNGVILITTKSSQEQARLEAKAKKEAREAARAAREAKKAARKK
jgi:TonB-dependent SusC/RagA subfamily outer membrane receptor